MNSTARAKENPRTTRVRQVMLDAAIELLLDRGAGEVTATRIAETTGVARTTIYRQWPDQASLLLATIEALVAPQNESPNTGDLEVDLRSALSDLDVRLTVRQVRPVFAALVDLVARDEAYVAAQHKFVGGLMQPTIDVLEAGVGSGALPATIDCQVAATTLVGPLLHQHLVARADISDELIDASLAQFLAANAGD